MDSSCLCEIEFCKLFSYITQYLKHFSMLLDCLWKYDSSHVFVILLGACSGDPDRHGFFSHRADKPAGETYKIGKQQKNSSNKCCEG